jgi:hypothetical protein
MEGVFKENSEIFFIGLRPFASQGIREDAEKSIKSYLKWGFYGRDVLINKFRDKQKNTPKTYLDREKRAFILNELVRKNKKIRTEDYLEACSHAISPRTAQLDLKAHPRLKAAGSTRARVYDRV